MNLIAPSSSPKQGKQTINSPNADSPNLYNVQEFPQYTGVVPGMTAPGLANVLCQADILADKDRVCTYWW